VYYGMWTDDEDFDRQVAKIMQAADNMYWSKWRLTCGKKLKIP
jgi:hypothetical protein